MAKAVLEIARIVVGFESGRDGFWIARALQQRGLEVYVMHAASIAEQRRGKRAKTDRQFNRNVYALAGNCSPTHFERVGVSFGEPFFC